MHSASRYSLVKGLTISSKRPCHALPRHRHRRRSESFHHSCHRQLPDKNQNSAGLHNTAIGLSDDSLHPTEADIEATQAKSDDNGATNHHPEQKPYGSARRRALRNRKAQDLEYPTLPPWFLRNNISEYEGLGSSWPKSLQILQRAPNTWLRRFPLRDDTVNLLKASPESVGADGLCEIGQKQQRALEEHFAVVPPGIELQSAEELNRTESTSNGSLTCPYSVDFYTFAELYRLYNGLMQLPQTASTDEAAAEKGHLVLQFPGLGGHYFLDAIVRALASLKGATMVTIDAQDIAELASGPYSNFERSFRQASRMISYDVYKKVDPADRVDSSEPAAREEDMDEETEDNEAVGPPAGNSSQYTVATQMIPLNSPQDLERLMSWVKGWPRKNEPPTRSSLNRSTTSENWREARWKAIVEAIFSAASGNKSPDRQGSQGSTIWENRNGITSTSEIDLDKAKEGPPLHAELNKAGVPSYRIEQPQVNGLNAPTRDIIIEVQDIYALKDHPTAKSFLSALFEYAEDLRCQGQRVMIIGTVSSSRSEDYDGSRKNLLSTDEDFLQCHTRVVPPIFESYTSKKPFSDATMQRNAEVNMRHFVEMLRHKLDGSSPLLSLDHNNHDGRTARRELDMMTSLLTFDEMHEKAMMLLGYSPRAEGDSWVNIFAELKEILRGSAALRREWSENAMKDHLRDKSQHSTEKDSSGTSEGERALKDLAKKCDRYEQKFLGGVIEPSNIRTTFAGVHVPYDIIDALRTLTTLSITRPEAFSYGVLATDKIPGLLMYGPPGTGKTLLAKAVAKESGAHVLEVSGAEVFDMYVGEAEKNIRALFSLAKKLSPCVIFIDEADALFGSRSGVGGRQRTAHREVINQFLKEWDGMNNDAGSAFIMVATNRPFDLDDAVLRRLPRRILVDLPTEKDRLEILKIHLKDEILAEEVDLESIAKQTPFYSGSDLKNLCVAAALNCVKEESKQAKEHTGQEPYKYPEKRVLSAIFFERALNEITASISEDMNSLKDIKKFDEQYGDKKKNRKKAMSWGFRIPGDDEKRETVRVRELA